MLSFFFPYHVAPEARNTPSFLFSFQGHTQGQKSRNPPFFFQLRSRGS